MQEGNLKVARVQRLTLLPKARDRVLYLVVSIPDCIFLFLSKNHWILAGTENQVVTLICISIGSVVGGLGIISVIAVYRKMSRKAKSPQAEAVLQGVRRNDGMSNSIHLAT